MADSKGTPVKDDRAGSYEIVVLDDNNHPHRTLYRSGQYTKALGWLEQNLPSRPNLDMFRDGKPVAWELAPGPMKMIEPVAVSA